MQMILRLFESGPGYDSIELNVEGKDKNEVIDKMNLVIATLYKLTDIEELSIGKEK